MNNDPLNNFPIVIYDPKGRKIPETFVNSGIDEYADYVLFGDNVEITGGFMEPDLHGFKEYASYAIFESDPNTIQTIPAFDDYNVGIDYEVRTADKSTKAWYSGEVISAENSENGYGNRVIVDTDVTYEFEGKEYQVRTAYAHLDTIDVQVGDRISQGQSVGEMGGTGDTTSSDYPDNYPPHVDLQISIQLDDGRLVNISPNLLQKQLAERFCKQYGPPTLEVLERQRSLPPGVFDSWSDGCAPPPPPPHAEDAENGFEGAEQAGSPLVLDLDGDGIELTAVNTTNVFFDVDGDGFREATGWVQSDDGLLVLDRNNDGYINDNSELFGNFTTSGFVELRAIDDNGDNYIDAADSKFADLQIWRDLDQDGRSDVNELYSLSELNITGLNAVAQQVDIINAGNRIRETTFYQLGDGTTRELADPWFAINQLNSYYDHNSTYNEPVVLTEEIFYLPNLKGYGNLPDLRIVMAKDGELLALVQSFSNKVASNDIAGSRELVESILYRWARVDDIDPASRGVYVDGQKLRFLEKFIGRNWENSQDDNLRNPRGFRAGELAITTYSDLLSQLEIRLLAQVIESPVSYNTATESYQFSGTPTEAIELLNGINAQAELRASEIGNLQAIALASFIQQQGGEYQNWILGGIDDEELTGDTVNGIDELVYGFLGNDILQGEAGKDTLDGGAGNDFLDGGDDEDVLDGSIGNDTLQGMADDDTYIFHKGSGHDVIEDYQLVQYYLGSAKENGGSNDTLRFGSGITRDNLRWNFDGQDLTFTLTDSPNDSLKILNYFDAQYQVETIEVAGTQLSIEEILNSASNQDSQGLNSLSWTQTGIWFKGLEGNDTITTGNHDDQLWGNHGSDLIKSAGGNDTLVGNFDNDTLEGGDGNDYSLGGVGNDLLVDGNFKLGQDTLDGGAGNDTLQGMADNDTYIFQKGFGHDVIEDYKLVQYYLGSAKENGGSNDILRFGSGITRDNLRWNFDGQDLTFTLTDSPNDSVKILNYFDAQYQVETIEVDGTQLSIEEILNSAFNQDSQGLNSLSWTQTGIWFKGLEGNDNITTGNYSDRLWGDDGDDQLVTKSGNDTLDGGNGNDTLEGGEGNDFYQGGAGDDLVTDDGFILFGQDILDGGTGNDTLQGMADDDLYLYQKGDGHDVIEDYKLVQYYLGSAKENGGSNDTLRFGSGITRDNLRWSLDGENLTFTLNNSINDSLTILNYTDSNYTIENIEVAGTLLTTEEILNPQFDEQLSLPIGELGRVSQFNHNSQTIELDHSYVNPVVFALPLSRNGGDPAIVRITDIQSDSFTAYLQEAEYKDGGHINESFSYLVLEAGTWELDDGTLLEVGEVNTNLLTTQGWTGLDFEVDFQDTPVILSQVQTNNGDQFVRTRQKLASVEGFSLSLEKEEALRNSGHATETVGWLAIEPGEGSWGELDYQAGHTANVINHQGYDLNFRQNFASEPYLWASLASFNGGDSAGLRYRNLNNSLVNIMIEEDQSLDSEIAHVNEIVDFLAISGTGDLTAIAYGPATLI